ncbi:caspase family protein [Terasakiella sp. SH-1]|uniref:caspase family protein n=1 Tax=Terasakiella sp. SH-1 TaxID=2560057 RepID=UPI0014315D6D|nr:caspase family protein [Terasakiella sp. SH-1]
MMNSLPSRILCAFLLLSLYSLPITGPDEGLFISSAMADGDGDSDGDGDDGDDGDDGGDGDGDGGGDGGGGDGGASGDSGGGGDSADGGDSFDEDFYVQENEYLEARGFIEARQIGSAFSLSEEKSYLASRWQNTTYAGLQMPNYIGNTPAQPLAPQVAAGPGLSNFPQTPVISDFPKGNARPDDIAVIISNADYSKNASDIPDVRPAYADAKGYRLYAEQTLGINPKNIIEIKDATQAQMIRVFGTKDNHQAQLYDWVKPNRSNLYVFYVGHGAPDTKAGMSYLVPSDADAARISLNGFSIETLYRNLSLIPARKRTVVLEACFSGNSQSGQIVEKASPVFIRSRQTTVPQNITVITAGGPQQIASWEPDGTHSLFSKYFLLGVSGEADRAPYGNQNGDVSMTELKAYLDETTTYWARRYFGREQHVQITEAKS